MRDRDWSATMDLPYDARAAGGARAVLRGLLLAWGYDRHVDEVVVVVSELVTNAVRHTGGRGSLRLTLRASGDVLRLEFDDGSSVRPLAREAAETDEGGRGMRIVEKLTARRGVEAHGPGKRVWVELDLPERTA